jgi:hypothetical protein
VTRGGGGGAACLPPQTTPGVPTLAQCAPLDGIMVWRPVEGQNLGPPVATFRQASCTVGSSFVAIATEGDWRLEVGIDAFRGFGERYDLRGGVLEPSFVIDGPFGRFSSDFPTPLAGGVFNGAGGIRFGLSGRQLGFAYGPVWGPSGQAGGVLILGGGATCTYPEDE